MGINDGRFMGLGAPYATYGDVDKPDAPGAVYDFWQQQGQVYSVQEMSRRYSFLRRTWKGPGGPEGFDKLVEDAMIKEVDAALRATVAP